VLRALLFDDLVIARRFLERGEADRRAARSTGAASARRGENR
jgi:hypothetical protein